ncbi:MAG TPA: phage tail tape measure protein [Desulfitobacteriaceae bacterium]|nr:phage tail tape measure protein [Desulfitobacteriaceae bacterium]
MPDDSIKALAVKIAMEDGNFQQGVKDLKQQLGVIDSEFKSSVAGVKNWGDSLDALKSNAAALGDKINVQQKIVQQYSEQLKKSEDALAANSQKMLDLKNKVESAKDSWEQSKTALGDNAEATQKLEADYKKLNKQYEGAESLVRKNHSTMQGYTIQLNNAKGALNGLESKLEQVNKEIDTQSSKWNKAAKSMEEASQKMKDTGDKLTGIGEKLSVGVTAPIVAAGGALLKGAIDAENAQGKLQASLGLTADEAADLGAVAQSVWINAFGENIGEATDAVVTVRKNIGSLAEDELDLATQGALTLADVFGADVVDSTKAAGTMMKNFGIDASSALDLITGGFQKGGDYSGELLDTLNEYSPQFASMGMSADQMMGILIAGAQAGAFNLDKVGDSIKEFNIRAQDGSDATAAGFKMLQLDATLMGTAMAEGGESAQKAFVATVSALANMDDKVAQNLAGTALFGTQWEDVRSKVIVAMAEGVKGIGDFQGATDEAAKAMYSNNPGAALTSSMRELQAAIGTALLPLADIIKNDIAPAVKSAADAFANLSPEGQKTVLAIAGIAAAAGPATWALGGMVKGVGVIAGGLGSLIKFLGPAATATVAVGEASTVAAGVGATGGLAGLGASLGAAAIAAAPFVAAGVAVVGTGYLINKAMSEEAIPAVDLFADKYNSAAGEVGSANRVIGDSVEVTSIKISEGTKKAVGDYMKLDEDASKALNNLYVSSSKITGQTVTDMVGKYNTMAAQIKAGMVMHNQQQLTDMQAFFAKSSALTAAEEAQALAKLQTDNTAKQTEIDGYTKRIQAILTLASQENRALTLNEQQEINGIQDKMKTGAVKALSEQELESKVILERLKGYEGRITAEQAAEVIKNANKQRDDAVSAANQQYDGTLRNIIKMRDESKVITADQATKMLADAEKQKIDSITKAEELKKGVVEKIGEMNTDVLNKLDTNNGAIKSRWQTLGDWFRNNPIIRSIFTSDAGSSYIGSNASGTDSWQGGPTFIHERGYELYDLPQGTRIFNHDASQDLVLKTAEAVARHVLAGAQGVSNVSAQVFMPQDVIVTMPVILDGKVLTTTSSRIQLQNNYIKARSLGVVPT